MSNRPNKAVADDNKSEADSLRERYDLQSHLQFPNTDLLSASIANYKVAFRVMCRQCFSPHVKIGSIRRTRDDHRLKWRIACRNCGKPQLIVTIEEAPE